MPRVSKKAKSHYAKRSSYAKKRTILRRNKKIEKIAKRVVNRSVETKILLRKFNSQLYIEGGGFATWAIQPEAKIDSELNPVKYLEQGWNINPFLGGGTDFTTGNPTAFFIDGQKINRFGGLLRLRFRLMEMMKLNNVWTNQPGRVPNEAYLETVGVGAGYGYDFYHNCRLLIVKSPYGVTDTQMLDYVLTNQGFSESLNSKRVKVLFSRHFLLNNQRIEKVFNINLRKLLGKNSVLTLPENDDGSATTLTAPRSWYVIIRTWTNTLPAVPFGPDRMIGVQVDGFCRMYYKDM